MATPTSAPFSHDPVLVDRVVDLFEPVPAGTLVDLTIGGGGHAAAVLAARRDLTLLGIDRDPQAIAAAESRLGSYGDRVRLVHARSDDLAALLDDLNVTDVVAVLADLGVSSPQLDVATRGFSYRDQLDGPLDMRMDPTSGITAATLVNESAAAELATILRDLGDERFARRIASAIVAARPVESTAQLADLVRSVIPAPARRRGGNPAKRTFQALRIAVNDELGILARTLDQMIEVLRPGGRGVVISYHSGEDRLVKARFRRGQSGGCTCPPGLPCACGAVAQVRLLKAGAFTPSAEEIAANRRAESARLRAIEKLNPPARSEIVPFEIEPQ